MSDELKGPEMNPQRGPQGLPTRLAVDANGYCWRVFDGEASWTPDGEPSWSMALTNPDNSPIPEPITFYEPVDPDANTEAEQDALKLGMVKAERDAARSLLRQVRAVFIDNAAVPAWEQTRLIEGLLEEWGGSDD